MHSFCEKFDYFATIVFIILFLCKMDRQKVFDEVLERK